MFLVVCLLLLCLFVCLFSFCFILAMLLFCFDIIICCWGFVVVFFSRNFYVEIHVLNCCKLPTLQNKFLQIVTKHLVKNCLCENPRKHFYQIIEPTLLKSSVVLYTFWWSWYENDCIPFYVFRKIHHSLIKTSSFSFSLHSLGSDPDECKKKTRLNTAIPSIYQTMGRNVF